jgi:type IV pilus assembly protein PilC
MVGGEAAVVGPRTRTWDGMGTLQLKLTSPKRSKSESDTVRSTSHVSEIARRKRGKKKAAKAKAKRFAYRALDANGKKVKGRITAVTQHEVYAQLISSGHGDVSVRGARSLLTFEISKKKVKKKKIAAFARQMSVFMAAGVPIVDALSVIGREVDDKVLSGVIADIIVAVRDGDSLSVALGRHPEAFSKLFVAAVGSAEQTGQLDVTLEQMAEYIDREVKMRSAITGALIYPGVVTVMGAVTVVVLSVFVLPKFQTFFASFNAKLPLPTRMLMSVSAFLSAWGVFLVGGIFLAVIGAVLFRKTVRGRFAIDTWMLRLPIVGPITTYAVIERICRILASMLRAGVDLPRAMSIAADTSRNGVYHRALGAALKDVMEGAGLADTIGETGLFEGTVQQMFRVGEETGTLDKQLDTAADFYGEETARKVDHATTLFEPMILIVVGGVVGFVAVAMISAMYGIYNQIHVGH